MLKFYAISNGQGTFVSNASRRSLSYRTKAESFVTTDLRQMRLFTTAQSCQITLDKVRYHWKDDVTFPFANGAQVVEVVFDQPVITPTNKTLRCD